jgi:hypothetical protein
MLMARQTLGLIGYLRIITQSLTPAKANFLSLLYMKSPCYASHNTLSAQDITHRLPKQFLEKKKETFLFVLQTFKF